MKVQIIAEVNQDLPVEVHLDDLIDAVNEMAIQRRWNYIAAMFNQINLDDIKQLTESEKELIKKYLTTQIKRFE